MLKRSLSILVLLVGALALLSLQALPLSAQYLTDTVAQISATRFELQAGNRVSFEIRVRAIVPRWRKLANATLSLALPSTVRLTDARLDSTSFNRAVYRDTVAIQDSIIQIAWAGPDSADACANVGFVSDPQNTTDRGFLVGRYSLSYTGTLPIPTARFQPIFKYQYMAYKLERDTIFPRRGVQLSRNDNIDLVSATANQQSLAFFVDTDLPIMNVIDFRPVYLGEKSAEITWRTTSEFANRGFVLARGIRPTGDLNNNNVDFIDTVAVYRNDTTLVGLQSSRNERRYRVMDSTIRYRDEVYAYKLLYDNSSTNRRVEVTTGSLFVPNSVISSVTASPNPLSAASNIVTIDFTVDDRVTVTVKVYDAFGREIATLRSNEVMDIGPHSVQWNAGAVASQGMYSVVITAIPTDGNQDVIRSTAFVKIQLIR